jgi:hypothetical protein
MPGKEVLYVDLTSSILGKLPVVRAGDTGAIPHKYRTSLRSGAHQYDAQLARADTQPGAGDGFPVYFVNSWVDNEYYFVLLLYTSVLLPYYFL